MIKICKYNNDLFEDAVEIFCQLSLYYLKENASDRETVAANLRDNILVTQSGMRLLLAYDNDTVCGLASYTILYPATKETGQMFLKELFISPQHSRKGIGEKMMSAMAKEAIAENCSRFDWTANNDSPKATEFYQKLQAPIIEKKKYYRLAGENLRRVAELSSD